MYFNPNEPPRPEQEHGPDVQAIRGIFQGDEAALQEQLVREILSRSPRTTIPISKPREARQ